MLKDFIARGLRLIAELEHAIMDAQDDRLPDQLLSQLIRVNQVIADTRATDFAGIALKSDYIAHITTGDPVPDIDEMEWSLIASLMKDISTLSEVKASVEGHVHAH